MSDVTEAVKIRSDELTEKYTNELDTFVNRLVPSMLDNKEYAARCSALMIALNRELARCSAAFGEVHGVDPELMLSIVQGQFQKNYATAVQAVRGQGSTVQ